MAVNPKRIMEKDNSIYGLLNSIKKRLENLISLKVNKAGDTMTGTLNMNSNNISNANIIYKQGYLAFIDAAIGPYVTIGSANVFFPVQASTATAPAYINGGLYFDTTLNKLRVGGATAWETVTSV